jgi:hypothetical protein
MEWVYPLLVNLVTCRSLDVRTEVRNLLRDRVGAFALGKVGIANGRR